MREDITALIGDFSCNENIFFNMLDNSFLLPRESESMNNTMIFKGASE